MANFLPVSSLEDYCNPFTGHSNFSLPFLNPFFGSFQAKPLSSIDLSTSFLTPFYQFVASTTLPFKYMPASINLSQEHSNLKHYLNSNKLSNLFDREMCQPVKPTDNFYKNDDCGIRTFPVLDSHSLNMLASSYPSPTNLVKTNPEAFFHYQNQPRSNFSLIPSSNKPFQNLSTLDYVEINKIKVLNSSACEIKSRKRLLSVSDESEISSEEDANNKFQKIK